MLTPAELDAAGTPEAGLWMLPACPHCGGDVGPNMAWQPEQRMLFVCAPQDGGCGWLGGDHELAPSPDEIPLRRCPQCGAVPSRGLVVKADHQPD